jgi:hypothetical protein
MEDCSGSTQKTQGKEELLQLQDGLLYCNRLLWVPENARNVISHTEHNSRVVGHFS